MLISRTGWMSAMVAAGVLLLSPAAWAQKTAEKPADTSAVDKTGELVERLALAAELTAFGRGELEDATGLKDLKSPEALVAAGGILLRIHKQTAGKMKAETAKVMDEEGKAIAVEGAPSSFGDEAASLFDEARAMAKDKAAIEAQIKQAESVPERGASGGPQVISRTVKSGKTHKVELSFEPHAPARVTMRGTSGVQFEVIGPGGKVLWHSQGSWGFYNWVPGRAGDKGITIKVINAGGPPVAYTITTN